MNIQRFFKNAHCVAVITLICGLIFGHIALGANLLPGDRPQYFPILVPEISSEFEIGVRKEGIYTLTYEDIRSFENKFINTHSYEIRRGLAVNEVTKESRNYTQTTVPQPAPEFEDFFGAAMKGFLEGSFKPFEGVLDKGMAFSITGNNKTDWRETYIRENDRTTSTSSSEENSSSSADSATFLNKVTETQTQKSSIDINAGYLKCGIKLKNFNKSGVIVVDPTFAVYFLIGKTQRLIGIAKAFRTKPASREDIAVPGGGKDGADLKLELSGLNYPELIDSYNQASGIQLILQNPIIAQIPDGPLSVLADGIQNLRESSVLVNIRSDRINEQAFVTPTESSGLTISEVLDRFGRQVTLNSSAQSATFAIEAIAPDSNHFSEQKLRANMPMNELIEWRKWIVAVLNADGDIQPFFNINDKLKAGYTVSLIQLTAKDVMGDQFRPVVYSKQQVTINSNSPFELTGIELRPGDRIVLSNARINYLKRESVEYDVWGELQARHGEHAIDITRRCDNAPVRLTVDPQVRDLFFQPIRTKTVAIQPLREFLKIPDIRGLPEGYDLERDVTTLFLLSQIEKLQPESGGAKIANWERVTTKDATTFESVVVRGTERNIGNWRLAVAQHIYKPFVYRSFPGFPQGVPTVITQDEQFYTLGAEFQSIYIPRLDRTFNSPRLSLCGEVPGSWTYYRDHLFPIENQDQLDSLDRFWGSPKNLKKKSVNGTKIEESVPLPRLYSPLIGSPDLLSITVDVEVIREGR